jgi:signal peptidase I
VSEGDASVLDSEAGPSAADRLWEQGAVLVLALCVAFLVRACVVEPYRIPSTSMLPTLVVGDHLLVSKFTYGLSLPFGDLRLPGVREPRRGDVIVFTVGKDGIDTVPLDRGPELPREQFVKRIVGLPGDRIEFREGLLHVNGEPWPRAALDGTVEDEAGRALRAIEVALPERRFRIADDPDVAGPSPESFVVEPGRYYVMGDNRDHSQDSRFWGTVARGEIRGPAVMLYWSWDFKGGWLELLDPRTWWQTEKRWDRVGARL